MKMFSMVGLWVEPGTSTMQLYSNTKLTVPVVKSHSKACSACTLLFSVNNYERLTFLTVNSSAAFLNPAIFLWLFKATKYIIFINVTPVEGSVTFGRNTCDPISN